MLTIPNFVTAGSGPVVLDLLRHLDRARIEPTVCVLKRGGRDVEVERLGVSVIKAPFAIPARPRRTLLPRAWVAARKLRGVADVWHSWHYLDDYTEPLIARLAGAKQWGYTKKNMSWGSRAWRVRSWLADFIIADNPDMLERFFSSSSLRRKTRVIPHGVDSTTFGPDAPPAELELLPRDALCVGCVAALVPLKDQLSLLRAAARAECAPQVVLVGKGSGEYTARLWQEVGALGIAERVRFLGGRPREEIPGLLTRLDVFVLSSRTEAFGVALLEAMACGLPCVATRCGGPETIVTHERDGLLIEPGDVAALARALDRLAQDPGLRARIGQAARRTAIERFSLQAEVQAHEQLYLGD